ncbi:hypothetical protein B0H16DRAFT_1361003 [Mycena metata]|uniref:Heterokaryon incompatibility domain-containing protein n=1 Tax=Mycena metata TaxID=1033252 RepID=A0AAD7K5S4_9AGAR|nr:hypothetical protein B0H16DRAFT_1361003 [Mycena metata]
MRLLVFQALNFFNTASPPYKSGVTEAIPAYISHPPPPTTARMWNPFSGVSKGFHAIRSDFKRVRLYQEHERVEGSGYFHKNPDKRFHVYGNALRIIFHGFIAPIVLIVQVFFPGVGDLFDNDDIGSESAEDSMGEKVVAPDAVLTRQLGAATEKKWYEGTGFKPNWLLKVAPGIGAKWPYTDFRALQVTRTQGEQWPPRYTALSYSTGCAEKVYEARNSTLPQRPTGGKHSLANRRQIVKELLQLYCSARLETGADPDVEEYIWLDEFCISAKELDDRDDEHPEIQAQRESELARMADIYRYAANVAVFCSKNECDHTDDKCAWGSRIWTIAEILNAQGVVRMTVNRKNSAAPFTAQLFPEKAHVFREAMQAKAAEREKWHLYAIFQQSDHGGATSLQMMIHALVVEAIRRDEASQFEDHKQLGCALNGLLPRRARPEDLKQGGWADLAWLLELNQAFYNAAALAAVCGINNNADELGSWIGKPIDPLPGNERLEPIVTAFPIGREVKSPSEFQGDVTPPAPLASSQASSALSLSPGFAPQRRNVTAAPLPPGAAPPSQRSQQRIPPATPPLGSDPTSGFPTEAPPENFIRRLSRPPQNDYVSLASLMPSSASLTPISASTKKKKRGRTPPLMIVGAQTLTLLKTLKRDAKGLSTNKAEMKGLKNLTIFLLFIVFIVATVVIVSSTTNFLLIVIPAYGCLMLYHLLELLVGTMYLERVGWVFVQDPDRESSAGGQQSELSLSQRHASTGDALSRSSLVELGNEDSHLRKLVSWGERQLVPRWEPPHRQREDKKSVDTITGTLVDLTTGVCVDAVVTEPPEFIIPLAIHGTGVSCLLLTRPKEATKRPVYWAKKVGMANFPTYVLAQADKDSNRTIVVGSSDAKATEEPAAVGGPPTREYV